VVINLLTTDDMATVKKLEGTYSLDIKELPADIADYI
jgi:hypothetical protein